MMSASSSNSRWTARATMSIASAPARPPLALLGQYKYDLVVCDMHMPGVDGPALYGTAQRQLASVPSFVFVTGYADVGPYEDFIRTTQAPVLGKPFDIQA